MEFELTLPAVISIVAVCVSIYFGFIGNRRSDTKSIEDRVARDTKTDMKLDEISRGVQDIKYEVGTVKKDIQKHNDRLVVVERSVEKAHSRIDTVCEVLEIKTGGNHE